jgi:hypothetical protein
MVDDLFEKQRRGHGKGGQNDHQGHEDGDQEPVGHREPQDPPNHTLAELVLGNIGILRHAPHHHVHRHGLPPRLGTLGGPRLFRARDMPAAL